MWDIFISHAREDKENVARPIAERLKSAGLKVWLDEQTLSLGDSLRGKIDEGLTKSKYGIVILSQNFFAKRWPRIELDGLITREDAEGNKIILPIWHEISVEEVTHFSPLLASRLAVSTSEGIDRVVEEVLNVVRQLVNKPVYDIKDIFDRDANISLFAAEGLPIIGDIDWNYVVQQLHELNTVTILSARIFLSRAAKYTAPLMVVRIRQAHIDWQAAKHVPDCFHPNHKPYCVEELAELAMKSDEPDVARLAIESLGFLAASGWSFPLFERLTSSDKYFADKIESYVVIAIARMFQLESLNTIFYTHSLYLLESLLGTLEKVIRHVAKRGWRSSTFEKLKDVIAMCPSDRADLFLNHWLKSDHPDLRVLSAVALSNMRLERTAIHLGKSVKDQNEEVRVRHAAAFALGNIGGPVAVRILRQVSHDKDIDDVAKIALARCFDTINQTDEFELIAKELLASDIIEKFWVHRAIGMTRNPLFLNMLHESINDPDHIIRGYSTLALARISGSKEFKKLEQCYSDATNPFEKIMTNLALLIAGNYHPSEIQLYELQQDLKIESYMYDHLIREDILRELKQCKLERAQLLAQCWERVYNTMP